MSEYMDDCMHIHACRRMQKIIKQKYYGMQVARGCNRECTAYEPKSNFYTYGQVLHALNQCADELKPGMYGDILVEDYL